MLAAFADFLPHGLVFIEHQPVLIDVIDLRARADFHFAARRRHFAEDAFQQRTFSQPIPPDHAEPRAGGQVEIHFVEERAAAEVEADFAQFDHAVRGLRRGRDDELHVDLLLRSILPGHFKITLDPVHGFCSPRAGTFADPFEFLLQKLLPLPLLLLLHADALRFREQEVIVTAVVAEELPALQLDDARGDTIEKIAVVRDEEARAGVAREKVFEPLDAAGVEMVRRFVEDEKIGPCEQCATQRNAPLFPAGKRADDP